MWLCVNGWFCRFEHQDENQDQTIGQTKCPGQSGVKVRRIAAQRGLA